MTLSFKTDPLESVLVSSTFDSLPSVRRHLQMEIENRLRDLFQKELPAMIHLLSNDWLKRKGLSKRSEDSRDAFFTASSSPESVSALFPAPNRTLSPSSVAGKNSAPPPRTAKTPKSQKSASASVSIAAQSAPADFVHEGNLACVTAAAAAADDEQFQIVPVSPVTPEVFDLVVNNPIHSPYARNNHSCYSEIGALPADQYYFRSHRSIIVRAPTDLALPDPVLIEAGKLLRRKPVNIGKLFKSLFKINEIEGEEVEKSTREIVGLRAIEGIGMGLAVSGVSSVKSSSVIVPDNFSVRSRTQSMLLDAHLNKALSTISGNRYNRYSRFNTSYNCNRSEADPDLVQFEPDEFRSSDFALNESKTSMQNSRTMESLDGESKTLAVKFGIMRRLQSTLATNNFVETNILYRTQSPKNKK